MRAVRQWVGGFIIVAGTVSIAPRVMAQQEGTTPDSVPLAARVDDLEQQIRVLKRLRELEADSITAAAKDKASVTANGKDGFSLKSADGKYVLRLRGYAQGDGRFYGGDEAKAVPNSLFLRRARPIVGPQPRRLIRRHHTAPFSLRARTQTHGHCVDVSGDHPPRPADCARQLEHKIAHLSYER